MMEERIKNKTSDFSNFNITSYFNRFVSFENHEIIKPFGGEKDKVSN